MWLTDFNVQRRRDDNRNKIFAFEGGGARAQRGKSSQKARFCGKRHDNKILKVQILLSRNFVVVTQAPECGWLEATPIIDKKVSNLSRQAFSRFFPGFLAGRAREPPVNGRRVQQD